MTDREKASIPPERRYGGRLTDREKASIPPERRYAGKSPSAEPEPSPPPPRVTPPPPEITMDDARRDLDQQRDRAARLDFHAGHVQQMLLSETESAPPGWEDTVEEMKQRGDIDNPFALARWMDERGYSPHDSKGKRRSVEALVKRATHEFTRAWESNSLAALGFTARKGLRSVTEVRAAEGCSDCGPDCDCADCRAQYGEASACTECDARHECDHVGRVTEACGGRPPLAEASYFSDCPRDELGRCLPHDAAPAAKGDPAHTGLIFDRPTPGEQPPPSPRRVEPIQNEPKGVIWTGPAQQAPPPNPDIEIPPDRRAFIDNEKEIAAERAQQAMRHLDFSWEDASLADLEKITNDVLAAGGKPDLCIIDPPLCAGNFGINREDMPQFPKDALPRMEEDLRAHGIPVTNGEANAEDLKPTQSEINAVNVIKIAKDILGGKFDYSRSPALIVSKDNFVLDGHHRWAAMWLADKTEPIRIKRLGLPMKDLLDLADSYSDKKKAFFEAPIPGTSDPGRTTVPLDDNQTERFRAEIARKDGLQQAMKPTREALGSHDFISFTPLREALTPEGGTPGRARVLIISEGPGNKRDRNYYSREAIESSYRVFEGKKCFLNHPSASEERDRPERDVREVCGWFSDPGLIDVNGLAAIAATLNFTKNAAGTEARALVESAIDFQRQFPDEVLVGLSINASGESHEELIDGDAWNWVDSIDNALSADLVTFPARGGRFMELRESLREAALDPTLAKGRVDLLTDLLARVESVENTYSPTEIADLVAALKAYFNERLEQAVRDAQQAAEPPSPEGSPGVPPSQDAAAPQLPTPDAQSPEQQEEPMAEPTHAEPDGDEGPNPSKPPDGDGDEQPGAYQGGGDSAPSGLLDMRRQAAEADGYRRYESDGSPGVQDMTTESGAPPQAGPPQRPPAAPSAAPPPQAQPARAPAPPPAAAPAGQAPPAPQDAGLLRRRAAAETDNYLRYAEPQQREGNMAAEKVTCEACGHEMAAPAPPAATPPMRASEAMQESERVRTLEADNLRLRRELREATTAGKRPLAESERAELTVLRARERRSLLEAKAAEVLRTEGLDGYMKPGELCEFTESQWPIVLGKLVGPLREMGGGEREMPNYEAQTGTTARSGSVDAALATFRDALTH